MPLLVERWSKSQVINVPVWWLTISKYQTIIGCECDFTFICYNGNLELSKTQLLDSLSHCLKDVTIEIKTKIEQMI